MELKKTRFYYHFKIIRYSLCYMGAIIFIQPLPGNKSTRCNCSSWMAHWEKCKGMKAIVCQELHCKDEDVVAVHVIKPLYSTKKTFVIPLCRLHRDHTHDVFQIKARGFLINIEPEESCEAI